MSNREIILEAASKVANKLPEDTPLEEIIRQIAFVAGIKEALEQSEREEGIPIEEVRKLVKKWASESSS